MSVRHIFPWDPDRDGPADGVDVCQYLLIFIDDCLDLTPCNEELQLSNAGVQGLSMMLRMVVNTLDAVSEQLTRPVIPA